MNPPRWDEIVARWAAQPRSGVHAAVMIGSRLRTQGPAAGDAHADWDFQLIVSRPGRFRDRAWWSELTAASAGEGGVPAPAAYASRATFGGVQKVTAVGPGVGEVDFVVLPALSLTLARLAFAAGLHRVVGPGNPLRRGLADLAIVIRPGHRFLAGGEKWQRFYTGVLAEISDPRLDDTEAIALAEAAVCDVVWLRRKIARGELRAAQRTLHQSLTETNFRLLHELRLRRGEPSLPEARRVERLLGAADLDAVTVSARVEAEELAAALERSVATLRALMHDLVRDRWRWPDGV